jgi:hypothetical protein
MERPLARRLRHARGHCLRHSPFGTGRGAWWLLDDEPLVAVRVGGPQKAVLRHDEIPSSAGELICTISKMSPRLGVDSRGLEGTPGGLDRR